MIRVKDLWQVVKDAGAGFGRHKVLKLSASLCFYTIFSLGPMMLVIIFISNLFWGRQAIEGVIYDQISQVVGNETAIQIQELIKNASISSNNFMAVISIIILIFTATTLFTEIHDSMNMIWNLRVKKGRGWKQMLRSRLLSFFIIAGLGLLLLTFLIVNGILESFMSRIQEMFPRAAVIVVYVVNLLLTLFVVALLFAFIYKVLPDAYIQWKDVIAGALFTAVLFMIGKFGITFYINNTNMGSTYGSAGSLVVLLLWIYYSATILYFGAEFTKAYALKFGDEIKPRDYAVTIKMIVVESKDSVQENEKNLETAEKSKE